jgi:hypothetical protein
LEVKKYTVCVLGIAHWIVVKNYVSCVGGYNTSPWTCRVGVRIAKVNTLGGEKKNVGYCARIKKCASRDC